MAFSSRGNFPFHFWSLCQARKTPGPQDLLWVKTQPATRWHNQPLQLFKVPSGNLTVWYGKSPFLMGKSTINHHFQ